MSTVRWCGVLGFTALLCACSGMAFSLPDGPADAAPDGHPGGGDGAPPPSPLPWQDASDDGPTDVDGSPQPVDGGVVEAGPPCPITRGAYTISVAQPAACPTIDTKSPECIRQIVCDVGFRSGVDGGAAGVSGGTTLQADGTFANAMLTEGMVSRGGCTGSWNAASSQMTITCPGLAVTQPCVVTLQRTGTICN